MDNVEWIKNGHLTIDGEHVGHRELILFTTDDVGFVCDLGAINELSEIERLLKSIKFLKRKISVVGKSLAFWAETDEDKALCRSIILEKTKAYPDVVTRDL